MKPGDTFTLSGKAGTRAKAMLIELTRLDAEVNVDIYSAVAMIEGREVPAVVVAIGAKQFAFLVSEVALVTEAIELSMPMHDPNFQNLVLGLRTAAAGNVTGLVELKPDGRPS
jgi:hypothetical protein